MEQELTPQTVSREPLPSQGRPTKSADQKAKQYQLILIIAGVVLFILFIVVIVLVSQNNAKQAKIDSTYNNGFQDGSSQQKTKDQNQFAQDTIKDTRTYESPADYGSFVLTLPKSYSLWVNPQANGVINGVSNPNAVDGKADVQAFRFEQTTTPFSSTKQRYDAFTKDKKNNVRVEEVTVSGIKGYKYTGLIDKKTNIEGTYIILPIRDKSLVLQTDSNKDYLDAFNSIIGQIKLNP